MKNDLTIIPSHSELLGIIIDQLSDAIELNSNHKVAAVIDYGNGKLLGWRIVHIEEDMSLTPIDNKVYDSLKELIRDFYTELLDI